MSFITVQHTNPGRVTKRLDGWSQIFGSNIMIETIKNRLDERYKEIYAAAPEISGTLRRSIQVSTGDDFAQIGVSAYYAIYVEQGRSPRGSRIPNPFWSNHIAGLSLQLIVDIRELFASRW